MDLIERIRDSDTWKTKVEGYKKFWLGFGVFLSLVAAYFTADAYWNSKQPTKHVRGTIQTMECRFRYEWDGGRRTKVRGNGSVEIHDRWYQVPYGAWDESAHAGDVVDMDYKDITFGLRRRVVAMSEISSVSD